MRSKFKKPSNTEILFMLAVMFIVLGMIASRGFLVIGITFLVLGMVSIGRQRVSYFDELERRINAEEGENTGDDEGGRQISED